MPIFLYMWSFSNVLEYPRDFCWTPYWKTKQTNKKKNKSKNKTTIRLYKKKRNKQIKETCIIAYERKALQKKKTPKNNIVLYFLYVIFITHFIAHLKVQKRCLNALMFSVNIELYRWKISWISLSRWNL